MLAHVIHGLLGNIRIAGVLLSVYTQSLQTHDMHVYGYGWLQTHAYIHVPPVHVWYTCTCMLHACMWYTWISISIWFFTCTATNSWQGQGRYTVLFMYMYKCMCRRERERERERERPTVGWVPCSVRMGSKVMRYRPHHPVN